MQARFYNNYTRFYDLPIRVYAWFTRDLNYIIPDGFACLKHWLMTGCLIGSPVAASILRQTWRKPGGH